MGLYFLAVSEKGVRQTNRLPVHLWNQFMLGANFRERRALPVMLFESHEPDVIDLLADLARLKLEQPRPMLTVN